MRLNPLSLVGIVLIVFGLMAFSYDGIPYTSRERVVDVGPLQARVDTGNPIPITPLSMGLMLVGAAVLVRGWAKKSS